MLIFEKICLQAVEVLTLIFGILGMTVSFFLLFSPNFIRSASNIFNRHVCIDEKIELVDKEVNIDSFFYSHSVIVGACLMAGSIFSLIFLFFKLDISHLSHIFSGSYEDVSANSLIFHLFSWIGKVACIFGLIFGTILLFYPEKMRRVENKLNFRLQTRPVVEKLNTSVFELDTVFFRHPIVFGITGLVLSVFVVVLSAANLLG
jgi:hypothetical protein